MAELVRDHELELVPAETNWISELKKQMSSSELELDISEGHD